MIAVTRLQGERRIVWHVPLPPPAIAEQTMGMPAVDQRRWMAAEVQALPEVSGTRHECVDGALLVTPAPTRAHQLAQSRMLWFLSTYLATERRAVVLVAPMEYVLDTYTVVQPDLSVIPLRDGKPPRPNDADSSPLLVVEILSPSTARYDRVVKRDRYLREGIEYWIVDLEARVVERWQAADAQPALLVGEIRWQMHGQSDTCVIDLPAFFDWVSGE